MIQLGAAYSKQFTVYDASGNPTPATTIVVTITLPDGTTQNPVPSVVSDGVYLVSYLPTLSGRHTVDVVTTGPNGAYNDVFNVAVAPVLSIVSLDDAKRQLGIDPTDTDDDDELLSWLTAMVEPMEKAKNEIIVKRSFTWSTNINGRRRFRLTKLPIATLDSIVGTMWGTSTTYLDTPIVAGATTGTYFIDPDTGIGEQINIGPSVLAGLVTFDWHAGYSIMPQHLINASMMLLQALWETRRGPGGEGGVIGPEELADYRHYDALPRKIRELLGPPRPVVF